MMRCRRAQAILVICAIACAGSSAARAQAPATSAAATAQFDKGRTLFKAGKYAEACAAFEQSQKLEAAFGTLYNLAGCYVKIGKLASAWVAYRELAQRDTRATRKADSAKRARELEPRLARLVIIAEGVAEGAKGSTPDGLVVTMNGQDVTALLGVENPVDLGRYQIVATAPQWKDRQISVEIATEGKTVTAVLELERLPREVAPPAPPVVARVPPVTAAPERDEVPAPASHRRLYGAIAGGAGLALVATSLVFGNLARGKWSDVKKLCGDDATCEPDQAAEARRLDDAAHTDANVATGLAIGGAVAIGVGAYLWLTAPSGGSRTALQLRPGAGPANAGLTLLGRF